MAARSVWSPVVTGTTVAPSNFMRPTLGAWRSMSTAPMYTVHGRPTRAQAAAVATPCWPAPVSATMRVTPSRLASSAWPERVVDLVRAGVREILALEPHFRAPGLRELGRMRQRRGAAHPAPQLGRQLVLEILGMQVLLQTRFEFLEGGHQRLGDVAPAEGAEAAARVGKLSGQLVGQQLGGIATGRDGCCHGSIRIHSVSSAAARAAATNCSIILWTLDPGGLLDATRDVDAEGPHLPDGGADVVRDSVRRRGSPRCGARARRPPPSR